ncbi:mechanosensitive ion channel family protein [Jannaschia rubra]|uniref:Putative mechanosensitive channel protein n=1 Tax=Jannaschia rubra TaxID=282197 RepID=A0A0M6XV97_9RHOB|nr:mechanosensitive ion channel family protein [Jannaschia rubra]CTQ34181.1 putative mechanosensitive channel protein [Jannaschia rubra]SFG21273.1 Mechanosensitive ion channel [Jannaschia rubra]
MDRLQTFYDRLATWRDGLPALVVSAGVLLIAIGAALALHAVIFDKILARRLRRDTLAAILLRRARRPLRLVAVLLAVAMVAPGLTLPLSLHDVLRQMAAVAIVILIGWAVLIVIDVLAEWSFRRYRLDATDNLMARKYVTQVRILRRTAKIVVVILTIGAVLVTFEGVREYGVSLFASAGAAGLVLGIAARPVLSNLIAGIQIALTQPIRLDDVVVIEGEWGRIEEIYATFVVVKIWDWRRMVVPLSYFIEQPFQNWTRQSATILGSVYWYVDYTMPMAEMRAKAEELIASDPLWDGQAKGVQVVDADRQTMQVRAVMSSRDSGANFDLRCNVREGMLAWMQEVHPDSLPRNRGELSVAPEPEPRRSGSDGFRPR